MKQFLFILTISVSVFRANSQTSEKLILFASGLKNPVDIANAGDSRLFVVEQQGQIEILNSGGSTNKQPFLNIADRVIYGGERGLLGVAFHPDFKNNGLFFVNYIGFGDSTHISRFKVNDDNPNIADPSSEVKVLSIAQPYTNHNGGSLKFGSDGYLYIGMGDGGSGGDPENRAQNPMSFLGKMLRIDVDHGNPYSIPATNPFKSNSSTLPEIWASGLRNPWKFSFDKQTGNLWIADVGQNAWEEIDLQSASSKGGENYGWRCYEGNHSYNSSGCSSTEMYTFPVYEYAHGNECSVTGGYVYRGKPDSPFFGHYFFADYCSDRIFTLHLESGNWVKEDFGKFPGNNFSSFGEDSQGQLYIAGVVSGKIFRISDQTTSSPEIRNTDKVNLTKISTSNTFRIETESSKNQETYLMVYDLKGKRRFQFHTKEQNFEVDLGALRSGTYLFNVIVNGRNHVQKLFLAKSR